MKKTSTLAVLALLAVAGCGRRLPVTAVVTDRPLGPGRQSVTRFANSQCVLNKEVRIRGPIVDGQQTYERLVTSGQPYPC